MKKFSALLLMALLVLFSLSCAKKATAPKAGSAKAADMLSLLPKDASGVIVVDVHRMLMTEAATKALEEGENKEKYQFFVQETGIDPQKDIFFFVGAMSGSLSQNEQEGVAIINMKYNKDLLLAKVQKERGDVAETDYNGLKIYQAAAVEGKKPFSGVFLDESNVVAGTDAAVKKVIDVYQKKAESILKNEELSSLIKGTNKEAMVYGAIIVPPETMKQAAAQTPMLSTFESITSLIISFDYKNQALLAEIKAMSADPEKNKQMADALNGFKALGAAAASKEPQLGELLNKIEIISTGDHVKITASVPDEIIKSLREKVKIQKAQPENPQD